MCDMTCDSYKKNHSHIYVHIDGKFAVASTVYVRYISHMQRAAPTCNTLQLRATHCSCMQHTAAACNTLHLHATHCSCITDVADIDGFSSAAHVHSGINVAPVDGLS